MYDNFLLYSALFRLFLVGSESFDFTVTFSEGYLSGRVIAAFANEELIKALILAERELFSESFNDLPVPLTGNSQKALQDDNLSTLLRLHIQSLEGNKYEIRALFGDYRPDLVGRVVFPLISFSIFLLFSTRRQGHSTAICCIPQPF